MTEPAGDSSQEAAIFINNELASNKQTGVVVQLTPLKESNEGDSSELDCLDNKYSAKVGCVYYDSKQLDE